MKWLPGGFDHLQLDIVGFLAILGEASVKANAQVSSLSHLSLIPRLLPAPQALIRTTRPERLKPDTGKVIGATSGGLRDYVNHIAYLLHSRNPLPAYAVRCEKITKPNPLGAVTAARFGPLAWVECLGAAMSLALLILAVTRNDGFALVATVLLSTLSTMIGLGNRWHLTLMQRKASRRVPRDNIVIQYPQGAFLVVKCDENIARELYWHPEECNYATGVTTYRLISLVGTITLMFGVICLGNSTLWLQIGFAAAYMILNVAYWIVAALPPQWHWDLSCYLVERQEYEGGERHPNFTQALWKAIAITESVEWVKNGQVAPISKAWKMWVGTAGDVVARYVDEREGGEVGAVEVGEADGEGDGVGSDGVEEEKGQVGRLPIWDPEGALTDFLNPDEKGRNV